MEYINYNGKILENYKAIYPNLTGFGYDEDRDALVYKGQLANLNHFGLSRVDSIFFKLSPDDLFLFFQSESFQIENSSTKINKLMEQGILKDDDVNYLKEFVNNFYKRFKIYTNNHELFDKNFRSNENIRTYMNDLLRGSKIIRDALISARKGTSNVAKMINDFYEQVLASENSNMDKGMSLARFNPNIPKSFSEDDYLNSSRENDKAGFISILLIIVTTIAVGIFLGIKLMA